MIANALTGLRLVLAVPVAWGIARPGSLPAGGVLALVGVAIATDFLDGIAARAGGTSTSRGRLYDHGTDFVFVTSALAGGAVAGVVPAALPFLVSMAFAQYVADSYWLHREKQLRMSALGRWNGILYFVPAVTLGVADLLPGVAPWTALVRGLSWALVASTVASILDRALSPGRGPGATFDGQDHRRPAIDPRTDATKEARP